MKVKKALKAINKHNKEAYANNLIRIGFKTIREKEAYQQHILNYTSGNLLAYLATPPSATK